MSETGANRGDDLAASPSAFGASLTELRAALAEDDGDGDREDRLNQLLEAFAAAARLGGIAPEAAVGALEQEWNRAALSPVLMYSRLSRDEQRLRAVDAFLAAYFTEGTGESSGGR